MRSKFFPRDDGSLARSRSAGRRVQKCPQRIRIVFVCLGLLRCCPRLEPTRTNAGRSDRSGLRVSINPSFANPPPSVCQTSSAFLLSPCLLQAAVRQAVAIGTDPPLQAE